MATAYSQRLVNLRELYLRDSQCPGLLGRTILLTPWADQPTTREFVLVVRDTTSFLGTRRVVHQARFRVPVVFESVTLAK